LLATGDWGCDCSGVRGAARQLLAHSNRNADWQNGALCHLGMDNTENHGVDWINAQQNKKSRHFNYHSYSLKSAELQYNLECRIFTLNNKMMATLSVTNKTIDKYFGFLRKLDNNSKKRLIIKLTESIETKDDASADLRSIYGAWEDSKDSDEIIKAIKESIVNNREIESF
jgi:hypothetical protein